MKSKRSLLYLAVLLAGVGVAFVTPHSWNTAPRAPRAHSALRASLSPR